MLRALAAFIVLGLPGGLAARSPDAPPATMRAVYATRAKPEGDLSAVVYVQNRTVPTPSFGLKYLIPTRTVPPYHHQR